jgi:copper(I)-binding protein
MHNFGAEADRLLGAATPAAGRVEIHAMEMVGDVMRMRPIAGVDIPAGGSAALVRGGRHLMLLDLPQPLVAGGHFELTLRFQRAGAVRVTVPVLPRVAPSGAAPPPAAEH